MTMTMTNDIHLPLSKSLNDEGLAHHVNEHGEVTITVSVFKVLISARPPLCDRGRWLVHASSDDPVKATIDWADGFPRYYFHTDCLAKEIATWIDVRMKGKRR